MLRKGSSPGKRACTGVLLSATLVGLCACSSQTPNTPQVPQTPQQPTVTVPQTTQPSVALPQTPVTQATWVIQGRKILDQDGNRQYTAQDKGVAGWSIRLYPSSAMQTNAWNTPLASTTTDANGNFTFSGIQPGTYLVVSAAQGNGGERLQQITTSGSTYAQPITLPQAATGYCQQTAYQVTVDNSCPQTCDLTFIDQGAYGAYGAGCASPYGAYGYPYGAYGAYGAGCVSPYGAYGYPYGACGYPYGVYAYPAVVPILVVDSYDDRCDRDDDDDHDDHDDDDNHHHNGDTDPT